MTVKETIREFIRESIRTFHNESALAAIRFFQWAVSILPRGLVRLIMSPLWAIAYHNLGKIRAICEKNLRSVYKNNKTDQEYGMLVKQIVYNIGETMADMIYYMERPRKLASLTIVQGQEHLKEALRLGKGAIVITAHLGNFPLMFLTLTELGYKVNVIIRPMRHQGFGRFMHQQCAKWNIKMIELEPQKEFFRQCLGALKRNELLFILLDEPVPAGSGVEVDFLDGKVERATGPLLFHERTGAPILPMFIVKNKEGRFEICVEEMLQIEETNTVPLQGERYIGLLTNTTEKFIRSYPEQWGGWLSKKWN